MLSLLEAKYRVQERLHEKWFSLDKTAFSARMHVYEKDILITSGGLEHYNDRVTFYCCAQTTAHEGFCTWFYLRQFICKQLLHVPII